MATPLEQLAAMRQIGENWDGYGAAAPHANALDLAQEFVALVEAMHSKTKSRGWDIHVAPTRIGGVLIDWDDGRIQHEIDIGPDRSIGFLHLNKITEQSETRKFTPSDRAVDTLKFSPVR